MQMQIRKKAETRNDKWGNDVLTRLDSAIDLPAVDACYHQACSVNFRTGKDIPLRFSTDSKSRNAGRPINDEKNEAFLKVSFESFSESFNVYKIGHFCRTLVLIN